MVPSNYDPPLRSLLLLPIQEHLEVFLLDIVEGSHAYSPQINLHVQMAVEKIKPCLHRQRALWGDSLSNRMPVALFPNAVVTGLGSRRDYQDSKSGPIHQE